MDTMNNEGFGLDERYFCLQCGVLPFLCEKDDHMCFDRIPGISFHPKRPRWYQSMGAWIKDNFVGIIGFTGLYLCSYVICSHFNFTFSEAIVFGVGSGFLSTYLFIMARYA